MLLKESLHPNAGISLLTVHKIPVNNFEMNINANMTARRKENAVFRVIEMVLIEKRRPLACLLLVGALFTNKSLDFTSEVNSHFCLFRRECRRRLRPPLDFLLNKVAVSFDIGVRCFFRLENRRRLLRPPRLDLFFFEQEALALVHMIALAVVLRLDRAAVISLNISVISSWITKKEEIKN